MGNKQEQMEAIVWQADYDLVAIVEPCRDHSHNWSTVMDGYKLFRRNRQGRKDGCVPMLEVVLMLRA